MVSYCESNRKSLYDVFKECSADGKVLIREDIGKMAIKVGRTEANDLQLLRAAFDADFDSKIDYKEFKTTMIGQDTDLASLL